MPTPDNTAQKLIRLPDKAWLFLFAFTTAAIGIVVSYMLILNTQTMLQQNDLDLQNRLKEVTAVLGQHALLINTNAVRIEALTN